MVDYLQNSDLYGTIERYLEQTGSSREIVQAAINAVYLNELLEADDLFPPHWMVKLDDTLTAQAYSSISTISKANPGVVTTSAAHGLVEGDYVTIYQIVGMTELNNRTFRVASAPATTTLTLALIDDSADINTSSYTAYSSGGIVVHRGKTLATSGIDVQRVLNAGFLGYSPMTPISRDDIEYAKWWDDATTRPTRYYHYKFYTAAGVEKNLLWWFPGCDADYTFRYWALTRAARLSAAGDVPLLPPQFHDAIITGALTRLVESHVQVENAVVWPGLYKMQREALIDFNRKYYAQFKTTSKPYML